MVETVSRSGLRGRCRRSRRISNRRVQGRARGRSHLGSAPPRSRHPRGPALHAPCRLRSSLVETEGRGGAGRGFVRGRCLPADRVAAPARVVGAGEPGRQARQLSRSRAVDLRSVGVRAPDDQEDVSVGPVSHPRAYSGRADSRPGGLAHGAVAGSRAASEYHAPPSLRTLSFGRTHDLRAGTCLPFSES